MPEFDLDAALVPKEPAFPEVLFRRCLETGSIPNLNIYWTSVHTNPHGEIFAYAMVGRSKKSAIVHTVAVWNQDTQTWRLT